MLGGPLGCKQMSSSAQDSQCPTAMYKARLAAELALPEQVSCYVIIIVIIIISLLTDMTLSWRPCKGLLL